MNSLLILCMFIFFVPAISFSQTAVNYEWYLAESNGGLCNASVVLYNDGTYRYESGCEASSHISYGTWTTKKDTVKFIPLNNKAYKVISTVTATQTSTDSISVTILDKNGSNITDKISVGLNVPNVGVYLFGIDISKTKKVAYKRINGKLSLRTLNRIFQQKFEFPTDTANNFIIKLNIPGAWIYSSSSEW